MPKVVLFPFNGEEMCFIHVLLNGLEMRAKGYEVRIVVEGAAVKLLPVLAKEASPMRKLYLQAREKGLFAGACKACSLKLGVIAEIEALGFEDR